MRPRPLAGVVEQVAEHLLEVLALALEAGVRRAGHGDRDALVVVDALERAHQRLDDGSNRRHAADHADARRHARAVEVVLHLSRA